MRSFHLVVFLMLCGSARFASAGLLTIDDGGFEGLATGVAPSSPSTLVRGAWTMQNQARISTLVGNPGQSMDLESGGSAASDPLIYQDVTGLTPGTAYSVGWDLRVAVNYSGYGNGPSFGVFLDTQTFASALYLGGTPSTSFVPLSTTFVATSATHRLFFAGELDSRTNGANNTDVSYYLDNVSFAPVPEPGTLSLLGIVGVCIGGYGWRKRRQVL
jgi:hypothetical protein